MCWEQLFASGAESCGGLVLSHQAIEFKKYPHTWLDAYLRFRCALVLERVQSCGPGTEAEAKNGTKGLMSCGVGIGGVRCAEGTRAGQQFVSDFVSTGGTRTSF